MKKSELRELVREIVGGYEPDGKGNLVPHSDKFDSTKLSSILTKVAKGQPTGGDAKNGEDVLARANQKNVNRILGGKKPIYQGEGGTMNLQQLVEYITGLSPEVVLYIPTIYPGGFGKGQQTRRTVEEAIQELTNLLDSPEHNQTQFELYQDSPTFKKFSVVISPEELAKRTAMVRSMGSLD